MAGCGYRASFVLVNCALVLLRPIYLDYLPKPQSPVPGGVQVPYGHFERALGSAVGRGQKARRKRGRPEAGGSRKGPTLLILPALLTEARVGRLFLPIFQQPPTGRILPIFWGFVCRFLRSKRLPRAPPMAHREPAWYWGSFIHLGVPDIPRRPEPHFQSKSCEESSRKLSGTMRRSCMG